MLWQLCQPVERGGIGMNLHDALKLTIDQAEFLLLDEKDIRRGDKEIRNRLRERGVLHEPKPKTADELMQERRDYFKPKSVAEMIEESKRRHGK